MRLIDADALNERFEKVKKGCASLPDIAQIIGVQSVIDSQNTAYDVDKVVEKLEDLALEHAINGQQYGEDGYDIHEREEHAIKKGIEEAIEIVKAEMRMAVN